MKSRTMGDSGSSTARADLPRVLVLDEELPLPSNTGKRVRTINLLRHLVGRFRIEILVHLNGASKSRLEELGRLGMTVHVAQSRVPEKRGSRFYLRLTRNLFSPHPYTVTSHYQRGYRDALAGLLRNGYDLIHCEWTPYFSYWTPSRVPWVVSAHNIESAIWTRLAATETHPAKRAYLGLQARRMLFFERKVFSSVRFATAVSADDARQIEQWGCPRVQLVPNGVDLIEFAPRNGASVDPRGIIFIGSMDWRANQDAVRWFLEKVHPRLQAVCDYRLTIVGRNPPGWLLERSRIPPEFEVAGEAADVRPYLERSAVVVVPLRVGGGSRLKILEAFACGKPVVSTRIGAEGLDVADEEDLLIADTPQEFAEAIRLLIDDSKRREDLGGAGRRLVEAQYGWARIADAQAGLWREAIGTRTHWGEDRPVS